MGSPSHQGRGGGGSEEEREEEAVAAWRLRMGSGFRVPDRFHRQAPFYARIFGGSHGAPRRLPPISLVCFPLPLRFRRAGFWIFLDGENHRRLLKLNLTSRRYRSFGGHMHAAATNFVSTTAWMLL